jgi:cephalosporin hydroxylase
MFYAAICELLGEGGVISIDIDGTKRNSNKWGKYEWEDRITFLHGGSTNPLIIEEIYKVTGWNDLERRYYNNGGLVILDSWHTKEHVLKEMELYSEFVDVDSYMIVEDTHVNGHPVPWEYGEGPYEAVEEWLKINKDWEVDYECEKHLMSFNPKGYLKRIEGGK